MIRVDNYISTSVNNPLLSSGLSTNSDIVNITSGAVKASGNDLNNQLQKLQDSKIKTQRIGMIAEEKKRQAELGLPEALRNIQGAQLNVLNTFLRIDETNRQIEENKEADMYALTSKTNNTLAFIQAQDSINAGVKPNGDGLFNNTKAWWDQKEKELVDNAPTELAKLKALESFTAAKTKALGQAILSQNDMRKSNVLSQLQEATGVINNTARLAPEQYDILSESFNGVEAQLKKEGFTDGQIVEQRKLFYKNLTFNTAQGFLAKGDIGSVKSILQNPDNLLALGEDYSNKLIGTVQANEMAALESSMNEVKATEQFNKFMNGTLSLGESGSDKIVEKFWGNLLSNIDSKIDFSSIDQALSAQKAFTASIREKGVSQYPIPKKIANVMGMRMLDENNPDKALAYASMINVAGSEASTASMLANFSPKDIAVATELSILGSVLPAKEAVKAANNIVSLKITDPAKAKVLETEWNTFLKDSNLTGSSVVKDVLDYSNSWIPFSNDLDEVSAEIFKNKYTQTLKTMFDLHGGNIEKAKESTKLILKQDFGITNINGKPEVMMFAPETIFHGGNMEYVKAEKDRLFKIAQLNGNDIETLRLEPVPVQGYMTNKSKLTYRVVNSTTGNTVMINDDNNIPTPLIAQMSVEAANKAMSENLIRIGQEEYDKGRTRINQYYRDLKVTVNNLFGGDAKKDTAVTSDRLELNND